MRRAADAWVARDTLAGPHATTAAGDDGAHQGCDELHSLSSACEMVRTECTGDARVDECQPEQAICTPRPPSTFVDQLTD
jgi:hypothetical protein